MASNGVGKTGMSTSTFGRLHIAHRGVGTIEL
jgi:hypothetical protein